MCLSSTAHVGQAGAWKQVEGTLTSTLASLGRRAMRTGVDKREATTTKAFGYSGQASTGIPYISHGTVPTAPPSARKPTPTQLTANT